MKTVGIIRERGQLTIPESVRKVARWISTSSVVSISIENPQEIIITPHRVLQVSEFGKLIDSINKSRSIKGKGTMSASEFLSKDREYH